MKKHLALLAVIVLILLLPMPAGASVGPHAPELGFPGVDCKEAPTPDIPGKGITGFFGGKPDPLPRAEDPFKKDAKTTIFEQYGYAGLRWTTYDLGCGPDAMRNPDAIVGTAIANWMVQLPLAFSALTGSLTQFAFNPSFMDTFDPIVSKISSALNNSLFNAWVPVVLALTGGLIILLSRKAALASTAAAIGWALFVILVATAIFRWPLTAGHAVDDAVTGTLGVSISKMSSAGEGQDPGTTVASNIQASILYRGWLAGQLGSANSATAKEFGPRLFKASALTWTEAEQIEKDRSKSDDIFEKKQEDWKNVASEIEKADPAAYEYLTGKRAEARVGYAAISAVGTLLALPFLLVSSLLMIGCFMIVRLAVMMFPAFATLGLFPSSRGIVIGLGRTVGAAIINAIVFGLGAGVTVVILSLLLNPTGAPAWLGLVLMPLFSFIMWVALKPFRRLTHMVQGQDHFGGIFDESARMRHSGGRFLKRAVVSAIGGYAGGAAGAATASKLADDDPAPPDRAEAQPAPAPTVEPRALPHVSATAGLPAGATPPAPKPSPVAPDRVFAMAGPAQVEGFTPQPSYDTVPPPTEPEWVDGEEIYPIYRGPQDELVDEA